MEPRTNTRGPYPGVFVFTHTHITRGARGARADRALPSVRSPVSTSVMVSTPKARPSSPTCHQEPSFPQTGVSPSCFSVCVVPLLFDSLVFWGGGGGLCSSLFVGGVALFLSIFFSLFFGGGCSSVLRGWGCFVPLFFFEGGAMTGWCSF